MPGISGGYGKGIKEFGIWHEERKMQAAERILIDNLDERFFRCHANAEKENMPKKDNLR
jgi:hypothetical protein